MTACGNGSRFHRHPSQRRRTEDPAAAILDQGDNSIRDRVEVGNPATTSTVVQHLTPGTWFFAISAYTQTGAESSRSAVVSQVIG